MISEQIQDVTNTTQAVLKEENPQSVEAVRHSIPLVRFSPAMLEKSNELKSFLMRNLYRHIKVTQTMEEAKKVIKTLFNAYANKPTEMNAGFASSAFDAWASENAQAIKFRIIADYIAGMTDRFASREYERIVG